MLDAVAPRARIISSHRSMFAENGIPTKTHSPALDIQKKINAKTKWGIRVKRAKTCCPSDTTKGANKYECPANHGKRSTLNTLNTPDVIWKDLCMIGCATHILYTHHHHIRVISVRVPGMTFRLQLCEIGERIWQKNVMEIHENRLNDVTQCMISKQKLF